MKKANFVLLLLFACLSMKVMAEPEVIKEGAAPGVWSMDLDAVMKQAKELKMPVLLLFTGSDWCHWCTKLDTDILDKEVWKDFAKENLMLGYLDFPQDESKVPEAFRARNRALSEKYDVEGYPTLILVDAEGNVIAHIEVPDDRKPESLIFWIRQPLRFVPSVFEQLTATMPEEQKTAMKSNLNRLKENKKRLEELNQEIEKLNEESVELDQKVDKEMDLWIIQSRLPDKLDAFKKAQEVEKTVSEELKAWLETQPEGTDENKKKFAQFKQRLKDSSETMISLLTEAMEKKPAN
jgi:protein disulfide-isomerase